MADSIPAENNCLYKALKGRQKAQKDTGYDQRCRAPGHFSAVVKSHRLQASCELIILVTVSHLNLYIQIVHPVSIFTNRVNKSISYSNVCLYKNSIRCEVKQAAIQNVLFTQTELAYHNIKATTDSCAHISI